MSFRPVTQTSLATPHVEGAGVHLHRAFGFGDPARMDPFLMFDDFRGDHPRDYMAGFPWHPHRGIETITYVLAGAVDHGDSLGNRGTLKGGDVQWMTAGFPWHPHRGIETITYVLAGAVDHGDSLGNRGTLKGGDVQWMTAGSGILHQEMPKGNAQGQMHGFQLWANLPRNLKMTTPRYQDVRGHDIPELLEDDGTIVKVIVGNFWGKTGPVDGIAAEPQYLDIYIPPEKKRVFKIDTRRAAFAYVFEGAAKFDDSAPPRGALTEKEYRGQELNIRDMSGNRTLIEFGKGDEVVVRAGADGVRFLLVSGAPIAEPVAWHGPIVMNTQDELRQAMRELQNGTFIKAAH